MRIPLSKPDIQQSDIDIVTDVLKSNILSIGSKILEFEKMMEHYIGVKHAVAVNSGTSALHLLVKSMNIQPGDEVITTPFSFVSSTNCFLFEGGKPVFVDIDENTMNMDINQIEDKITNNTKMIIPVDVFGQPMDIEKIMAIAKPKNIKVIEDSCEAIGSSYKGKMAGSLGDAGTFAFYPNKQMTTAEGGMIITNDDALADNCRSLRSQGRAITGTWLHHQQMGYNYRLSELHSALGVSQLERLDELLSKREAVANMYTDRLKTLSGITTPFIDPNVTKMSWFVYTVRLDDHINREEFMKLLLENNIDSKPYFTPIHLQPYMRKQFGFKEGDFPITEKIGNSTIAIPFYSNMKEWEVEVVCDTIESIIGRF